MQGQDYFRHMVRDHMAPLMHGRGFRGVGPVFRLPSDDAFVAVGLTKDRKSLHGSLAVHFTVNMMVVSVQAWEDARRAHSWLPDRPSVHSDYATSAETGWHERLGRLIPGSGGDRWYLVGPQYRAAAVAEEVVHDLDRHGMPHLRHRILDPLAPGWCEASAGPPCPVCAEAHAARP